MAQRKTKAQFIQDAQKVHGDKYDYSLVEYINADTKVKIICPEHGVFEQLANNHLRDRGCAKCVGKFKTTDQFIKESKKIHGDRYNYSLCKYAGAKTKVKIICREHGAWDQDASSHIGGAGCPACGGTKKRTTTEFIQYSLAIHGNKYDYSLVEYVNNQEKVKIICRKHGLFEQRPASHTKGKGCDKCAGITRGDKRRKTLTQFVQDARKVHGDKYDYLLAEYTGSQEKIKIICREHGVFEQIPNNHLKGQGCPVCSGRHKTKLDFIQRSQKNHGGKYDYSLVDYTSCEAKVKIICPDHGVFEQRAICHARGQGCPMCIGRMKTTDKLVEDFMSVHGNKYDYSLVEYVNSNTKVKIICTEHGVFEQLPSNHLMGKGCIDCAGLRKKTTNQFIQEAKGIHGDKYNYSLVEYVNANTKVKIICTKHGVFEQIAGEHLAGSECCQCGLIKRSDSQRKSLQKFTQDARQVHGDKYDYSLVEYVNANTKVKIICPEHGAWEQVANSHLNGCGCPLCAKYGFQHDIPGILYLLKFQKDFATFWKIGITNRTIEDRFLRDSLFVKDRHEWQFEKGICAYKIEQKVLKLFRGYKQPSMLFPLLDNNGDTECFTLNLPYKKVIAVIENEAKKIPIQ